METGKFIHPWNNMADEDYVADFVEEEARAGRGSPVAAPLKNIITRPTPPPGVKATAGAGSPGFGSPMANRLRSTSPRDPLGATTGSVRSVVPKAPSLGFTGSIQPHTYLYVGRCHAMPCHASPVPPHPDLPRD